MARPMVRVLLVGGAVVLAVVVIEIVLRLAGVEGPSPGGYPRGLYARDDVVGYGMTPGLEARMVGGGYDVELRLNGDGYRDAPFGEPGEAFRILALGDSFGFGHGVEEERAYPTMLEAELAAGGRTVEVLNLGVPGYDTIHQARLLERDGPALAPDLVLVACYAGNDVSGAYDGRTRPLAARFGFLTSKGPDESETVVTLRAALNTYSRLWHLVERSSLADVPEGEAEQTRLLCEAGRWGAGIALEVFLVEPTPRAVEGYAIVGEALEGMARLCREELGCPLVLVLLPAPNQYDAVNWNAAVQLCGLDPADYDLDAPARNLGPVADAAGFPWLDLSPAFRTRCAAEPGLRLYTDVHFNAEGHAVAASAMARFLTERGLVP